MPLKTEFIIGGTGRASRIFRGRKLIPVPVELTKAVVSVLASMDKQLSLGMRCHDYARLLRDGLIRQGHKAVVKDGDVIYDAVFCRRLTESRDEDLSKMPFARFNVCHSWCEVGDMRIDFHRQLAIRTPGLILMPTVLTMGKIGDFDGLISYDPYGREHGFGVFKFIYFSGLPPAIYFLRFGFYLHEIIHAGD